MFSKIIAHFSFAVLAVANPTTTVTDVSGPAATTISQCIVPGGPQCCDSVLPASNPVAATLLDALGIVVSNPTLLVGINCHSVDIGSPDCNLIPVCCDHNDWNGIITIGCAPISL